MIAIVRIDFRIRIICHKSSHVESNLLYKKLRNDFDLTSGSNSNLLLVRDDDI